MDEPRNDIASEHEALDTPSAVDHRHHARPGSQQGNVHSEEVKAYALSVFAETGSVQTAAEAASLPRSTVDNWVRRDPDIDAKLEALRRIVRERVAHTYAEIARRAAEELLDRVNNGDYHTDKEGEVSRRPVPARELAFISSIATDKHALLTGTMTKTKQEDQALTQLAERLVKAFETQRLKARAIDAPTYPQPSEPGSAA